MSKFLTVAAPGAVHVCRRMRDGSLLSVLECPSAEVAAEQARTLEDINSAMPGATFAGRKLPLGHVQAAMYERRPVRWFSDAEAL